MTKDKNGNYVVLKEIVEDINFWKKIAKYALDTEASIERSYARTWGEEGEIALQKAAKELFDVEIDLNDKEAPNEGSSLDYQ